MNLSYQEELMVEFELTQTQKEYLSVFMDKVSRSFAVVVAFLEEPLNHYLATAYLICRVADNIEDCEQSEAWQQQRFAELSRLLKQPNLAPDILSDWEREAWPGLTSDEEQLMGLDGGLGLWQIYALLPDRARSIIDRWASTMIEGMMHLEDPEHPPLWVARDGVQVLEGEEDYNCYCYFVAGTVGHMATELVIDHYQLRDGVAQSLLATCEACGRGLQKTNIVKDFAKDLARGVCYLPDVWMTEVDSSPLLLTGAPTDWKRKVVDNVMAELAESVDYVLTLPYSAVGYRMASLLCLLPAYQTIFLAAQRHQALFTAGHHVKISRETLAQCLRDAQSMVHDNEALLQYSRDIKHGINLAFNGTG